MAVVSSGFVAGRKWVDDLAWVVPQCHSCHSPSLVLYVLGLPVHWVVTDAVAATWTYVQAVHGGLEVDTSAEADSCCLQYWPSHLK